MVNSLLIRPAISWTGWHWGGPFGSHDISSVDWINLIESSVVGWSRGLESNFVNTSHESALPQTYNDKAPKGKMSFDNFPCKAIWVC